MGAPWLIGGRGLKKTLVPQHLYHKAYRFRYLVQHRARIRGPQDYLDDLEDPPEDEDYDVLSDA
jgi:hypothetical protein